jgi:hypothetical protein
VFRRAGVTCPEAERPAVLKSRLWTRRQNLSLYGGLEA